jgi:hypothetical protein
MGDWCGFTPPPPHSASCGHPYFEAKRYGCYVAYVIEIAYPDAHVMFGGEFQPVSVQVTGSVACVPFAVALIALQELNAINLYSGHALNSFLAAIIHYQAALFVNILC